MDDGMDLICRCFGRCYLHCASSSHAVLHFLSLVPRT